MDLKLDFGGLERMAASLISSELSTFKFALNFYSLSEINSSPCHRLERLAFGIQTQGTFKSKICCRFSRLIMPGRSFCLDATTDQSTTLVSMPRAPSCDFLLILPTDMQKFPLRMKDNDLLVTELYRDPANDQITSISVYLTPKTTSEYSLCLMDIIALET